MTFINPISGAALPAAQAQERLAADKARQINRQQVARRVTAASAADRFEHVVENAEPVARTQDDEPRRNPQRHDHDRQDRRRPAPDAADPPVGPEDAAPGLDVRG